MYGPVEAGLVPRIRDSRQVDSARGVGSTLRQIVAVARNANITFLAAAVAYYGFVSIVPLLLVAIAVGTWVAGPELTEATLTALGGFLTSSGELIVRDALANRAGRAPATVVGLLLLTWSSTKFFRGLDAAFSAVYGVPGIDPITDQLVDALVVLVVVGLAVVAAVGIGIVLPTLITIPYAGVLATVGVFFALTVAFLPAFYRFPDVEMPVREALPGTLLAAAIWTVLTQAFRVYSAYADGFQLYGIFGAAILLVTFFYLGATIIMLGAVANAVLAGRTDDESSSEEEVPRPSAAPDVTELARQVRALELEVDAKTISRQDIESELKGYVRSRMRRSKARGWGPYLVLLYGTVMTLGAFYYLEGMWAIGAMFVLWLSTLGLYALMLMVGVGIKGLAIPASLLDRFRGDGS